MKGPGPIRVAKETEVTLDNGVAIRLMDLERLVNAAKAAEAPSEASVTIARNLMRLCWWNPEES